MRKSQSSMTAIGIAIVRAIESDRPEAERICFDPYARQFVNGALYQFVRFFDRLGYSERRGPGVMGFLTVRERHIDEYLKTCLADGVQQVVILGAGYDARAYRFEEFKRGVKAFEVDHPATQQAKRKKLEKIFGSVPQHVTYVSIDFNTQTLEQRLPEFGYVEQARTLFIWQGVTQYLTPEGVDGTLAFVAQHSAPGSSIIFDYMYTSLLDGTVRRGEVSKMRRDRWLSNEVLAFGIPEGTITCFMEQRGFTHVHDANFKYLHDTYFSGVNAKRTVADGYAIVSAVVAPTTGSAAVSTNTAAPATIAPTPIPATATAIPATAVPTQVPASPTSVPATADPNAPQPASSGVEVFVGPLSLVLPPGLASGVSGSQIPRNEGQDLAYWDVTPGHTILKLEGYLLQGKFHQPQIYVYPAQAYAEMVPGAFESIRRLDNILYGPGTPISVDQLPAVPFFNAQQAFASNIQKISFQNGGGVRFLTEYAQYPVSANDQDLFYQFQGLTRDGAYYIIAILPISHPALAETSDGGAVLPAGGVPYPDITTPSLDMPGYYNAVTDLLNAKSPEAFTPAINQLDALIQSMRITP